MSNSAERLVIDAGKRTTVAYLAEIWRFRDLLFALAYRDYRVRYAQTRLGLAWAFFQPAATVLVFTLVFGQAVKVDTGPLPYPVFSLCGLAVWSYFAFVMAQAGASVIQAQEMVKKIYFPRLILPLSKALVGVVELVVALALLALMMVRYGVSPGPSFWLSPLFLIAAVSASLGVGLWLSALTVRYRDFQHVIPFVVQIGLYVTPVAYPAATLVAGRPAWARVVYYLNPMAGIVEGFRWSVVGGAPPAGYAYVSLATTVLLLASGIHRFQATERTMADIV